MRIVGGSGQVGLAVTAVLGARGHGVVPVSRSTGVDAYTGVGVAEAGDRSRRGARRDAYAVPRRAGGCGLFVDEHGELAFRRTGVTIGRLQAALSALGKGDARGEEQIDELGGSAAYRAWLARPTQTPSRSLGDHRGHAARHTSRTLTEPSCSALVSLITSNYGRPPTSTSARSISRSTAPSRQRQRWPAL